MAKGITVSASRPAPSVLSRKAKEYPTMTSTTQFLGHSGINYRAAVLFYFYATLLTLMPALPFAFLRGEEAAFMFLTGDAYLYLGIADHSTDDIFSFDGERPTNGFHPLWQFILWFAAQRSNDPLILMNISAWGAIACTWVGVILLGTAVARSTGSWLLAGLVVPGIYFLLIGQGVWGNLSVWNFFNGMEAGLALALTGAIALWITQVTVDEPRLSFWLVLGVLTGLLMLCRLDEVFVSAAIGAAWLVWYPRRALRRMRAVVALGLPPLLMLAIYMVYNLSYAGAALPVSGAAKGEGALMANTWVTLVTFFGPIIDLRAWLTDYTPYVASISAGDFRVAQLVFPMVMSMGFIVVIIKEFRDAPWAPIVAGMCTAIIIKGLYNGIWVNYWHQASWYFAFAHGTLSFTAALLLAPVVARWRAVAPSSFGFVAVLVAGIGLFQASQKYLDWASEQGVPEDQVFFYGGEEIDSALEAHVPGAKIMEFGDGIVNFTLDRPVRHGFMFAGDVESLRALQDGRLLQASYEDGYRILTSFEYYRWPDADLDRSSDEIRNFLSQRGANYGIRSELDDFDFEVIYIFEPTDTPFIAYEPR